MKIEEGTFTRMRKARSRYPRLLVWDRKYLPRLLGEPKHIEDRDVEVQGLVVVRPAGYTFELTWGKAISGEHELSAGVQDETGSRVECLAFGADGVPTQYAAREVRRI